MKKDHQNDIWVGAEELNGNSEFLRLANQEFEEKSIVETMADAADAAVTSNRRDFLKYLGFGLGAATVAASCDIPVKKAIPYVVKPDSIVPGVATYYASSFVQGGDYSSVLVKTREGRPIKIEGNTLSKVTMGGTGTRAQAS
ncbi:MAG TPA: TAT-variant-translocated molybdopterin oxidoreductase, partial [Saprospiraceae bacterium]|nr:TAT-variant-translocated molybdopterin oxidoreductase [Saprospiraceae bacterium]